LFFTRAALQYLLKFDPHIFFLPTVVQSLNVASSQSDAASPPLCIASLNLSTNLLTSSPPAAASSSVPASSSSASVSSSLLHLADLGASLRSLCLARNMLDRLVVSHFAPLAALRALDVSNNQLTSLDGVEALPNLHSLVRASNGGRPVCRLYRIVSFWW
jgi:hypothetical protein